MVTIDHYNVIHCAAAYSRIEESMLYYDRRLERQVVPGDLSDYVRGIHHLHLKQVPSALTIRKSGTKLSKAVEPHLAEDGFFPALFGAEEEDSPIENSPYEAPLEGEDSDEDEVIPDFQAKSGWHYEDPWKIFAGWSFASQYMDERPKINVWPGGCHRIQDKLSPKLFGSERKNSTRFTQVEDQREKMYFIFSHTHWGHRVQMARRAASSGEDPLRNFANTFFRRISFFLRGLHDPIWTKEERSKFADYSKPRNKTYRAQRLIEVLKTVDGLFLQRFLSYPEEIWDWEKYDLFVLQAISIFLTDEFIDGEISVHSLDNERTHYEQMKSARKQFKLMIHKDECSGVSELDHIPRWIQSFYRQTWKRATCHNGYQRLFLAGTLSQTRGSGTPPPLVVLRSKRKFLLSVSELPPVVSPTARTLLSGAMDEVMRTLPDHIFTGLSTKARVTVTGSACWEATRKDGGTAQAILDLMKKYDDLSIPVRDMETGNVIEWTPRASFESIGTAIFHACLDEVLNTSPETLREVSLTIVREPGKARVVTKGHAALKIVLDTVSKICSWPLKKGFKSSESGMGKAHHGWNLFKDFSSDEIYELMFKEDRSRRVEDVFNDHIDRVTFWEDIYFASTDYQEATDRLVHSIAKMIAVKWMERCGIPKLLQGLVCAVCYRPRTVFFSATGALKEIGLPLGGDQNSLVLHRGVLMGDPLTKVILHFTNILSRKVGEGIATGDLLRLFPNGNTAYAAFQEGMQAPQTKMN